MFCTCATRLHSVIWAISSRSCKSQPVRDGACKSRLDMKEELGLMLALQGRILVKGSQSKTTWIYSSGEKDTQDGTDKFFFRWVLLKAWHQADILFHNEKLAFIPHFLQVNQRYWCLRPLSFVWECVFHGSCWISSSVTAWWQGFVWLI